ncbi:FG-GAP repeat protein [Steroidobacter flavus]|uniref:FG-GAP repeat protein n=1 Tax=Steroidobacter flavus TaxID=1842136 RepID=A0ABV8SNG7_9GAMM
MRIQACSPSRFILAAALTLLGPMAIAGPAVYLEKTRLTPTDGAPAGGFGRAVAIDGNTAVVSANAMSTIHGSSPALPGAAYVFERNGAGVWQQTAKLTPTPANDGDLFGLHVAIDGDVIAVGAAFSRRTYVFEKQGAAWAQAAVLGGTLDQGNGFFVAVENGVVAISHTSENGMALYRRGASGWARIATYNNGTTEGGDQDFGPRVDITANHAIHGSFGSGTQPSAAFIYTAGSGGNWASPTVSMVTRSAPGGSADGFGSALAISGNTTLISQLVYERDASGAWLQTGEVLGGAALDDDEQTIVGLLAPYRFSPFYRRSSAAPWPHSGELAVSDSSEITAVAISASRVVAGVYPGAAYIFEIPENVNTPDLQQDDFQDGDIRGWATTPGSLFAVANDGRSLVMRQTSVAGNAAAAWAQGMTLSQSIQADITPRAFDGADRWFGLFVRQTDANNYYYITARSGGGVHLKRMLGGRFTTLGSASLPVALNRTHRLRIEAVDDHVRVLVNERPVIRVRDSALTQGQPGVMMYKTRADYDNVIINTNPAYIAFADNFEVLRYPWQTVAGQWERVNLNGSWVSRQSDVTGGARAVILGGGTGPLSPGTFGDQIVQANLRVTQFSGPDRWVGLLARYLDDTNYHYVTLRNSGAVSIRRLVNGNIQTLASTSYPVTANVTYRVRFESVGTRLRAYINDALLLEATDPTLVPRITSAGVGMYKAAAYFDNFSVQQP